MIIHSVRLFNFMGFQGEHFRKFVDKDIIGIIAEFKDNQNRSNQAGKTTVLEAMSYALFGVSRAEKEIELIHNGEDQMWVELILSDGKKKYTIKRGRDVKNNGLLEVDFQDKKKEGQEAINELVGYDKNEFLLTTFFKQADINQFMDLSPAEKKKHIIKWFNVEHWTKLEKAVKEDLSELNSKLSKLKIQHEQLKATFDNDVDLELEKTSIESEIEQLSQMLKAREEKLKKLESSESMTDDEYESMKAKLKKEKDRLSDYELTTENAKNIKEQIEANKERIKSLKEENEKLVVKESVQSISDEKAKLNQELKIIHAKVQAYENKKGGICPIIFEECDRIQFTEKQYKEFNARRSVIPEELDKLDKKLRRINKIKENEQTISRLQDSNASKNESINEMLSGVEAKIKESKDKIQIMEKSIKDYNPTLNKDKLDLIDRIARYKERLGQHQKDLGRIEEKIEAEKRNKAEVKRLSKEIKEVSVQVDDLNYLAMMFGKNGIPSQEIENGFQQVEDDANILLESMSTGMEIMFKPTRELDQKEPTCLVCGHVYEKGFRGGNCPSCKEPRRNKQKDELNFQVLKGESSHGFYMDSGGGKSLLSASIRMALTQLKRRVGKCNLSVVFLDEPDSALDSHNAEQFTKMITNVLTKQLGIAQVFWVSHNKDIQWSVPHVLKVINDDGKASFKWV